MIRKTSAIYVTRGAYSNMGEKRMEFRSIVGNSLIISIITIRPCISMNVDPNFNVNWYNIYCEKPTPKQMPHDCYGAFNAHRYE